MNRVIYRAVEKRDFAAVARLIEESFMLRSYLPDARALTQWSRAYLQSCFAEQTYCRIAEWNGKILGVIMGRADQEYRWTRHIVPACSTVWHDIRMELRAKCSGYSMDSYRKLHRIYREMLANRSYTYDGVLTLFAVDKAYRGAGVGTLLLKGLEEYFRECGVRRIYLYTDSTCNTGFYDHHSFVKVIERDMPVMRNGQQKMLKVFLYEKSYDERS